jgi:hypothetical protein
VLFRRGRLGAFANGGRSRSKADFMGGGRLAAFSLGGGRLARVALQEFSVALIRKGKFHRLCVIAKAIFCQGKTDLCKLQKFRGAIVHGHKVARMDDVAAVIIFEYGFCCRFSARENIAPFVRIELNGKYAEKSAVPQYFAQILLCE